MTIRRVVVTDGDTTLCDLEPRVVGVALEDDGSTLRITMTSPKGGIIMRDNGGDLEFEFPGNRDDDGKPQVVRSSGGGRRQLNVR